MLAAEVSGPLDAPLPTEEQATMAQRQRLLLAADALLAAASRAQKDLMPLASAVTVEGELFLYLHGQSLALLHQSAERNQLAAERQLINTLVLVLLLCGVAMAASALFFGGRMQRQHQRLRQQAQQLERLALVAECTSNVVVLMDPQGVVSWVNAAYQRLTGMADHEAVGCPFQHLPLFAGDGSDHTAIGKLAAAVQSGQAHSVDLCHHQMPSSAVWLQMNLQPLHGSQHQLTGFVWVGADISALVLERQRLQGLLQVLPAGVVLQDGLGAIVDANPAAERMLGLTRAQLLGSSSMDPLWQVVGEDGLPLPGAQHPAMLTLSTQKAQQNVLLGVSRGQARRSWLRVNTNLLPMPDCKGSGTGVVSSFVDVTEVGAQRRLLQLTVEAALLGTWDWHVPSGYVEFNDRWWTMLGLQAQASSANVQAWEALLHPDDLDPVQGALQLHFADPGVPYRCEFRMKHQAGYWVWIMAAGSVVERDESGGVLRMAGVHLDISSRKKLEQDLSDAALTDALTMLPNRAALKQRLAQCCERSHSNPLHAFGVLFLDFDRFKNVNDSLGHEAGDELLRQVAQRLRETLRPGDDVARLHGGATAARMGGDEFVVLLEALHRAEDAAAVANRVLTVLAAPYAVAGTQVQSSVSVGVAFGQGLGVDADALLRDADTAMYEAKRRGRGRVVVFTNDMHDRVRHALDLEADLRQALTRDGEVFAVYQPIVDLHSGKTVGTEALARWRHPVRGLVPPVEFIPLAEENELIGVLGERVLRMACTEMARWQLELGAAAPATMSVNLSRAQIRRGVLPTQVARVLAETGLRPEALRLEVTESLAMQDEAVTQTLADLRALGVSLALDDFGTGYSSLASLDQMPLDAVKIDRSFVHRMAGSVYQTSLVEATLRVAASLQLQVVAEGVETEAQAQTLRRLGCQFAQGYYFGKPMSAAELLSTLAPKPTMLAAN